MRLKDFGDELYNDTNISFNANEIPNPFRNYQLDMETRRQVAMIFKEAMNNSLKHSDCTSVSLKTELANNILHLELNDNGKGFDTTNITYGNGLANMKYRSDTIKGELVINSSPSNGTSIVFLAPVSN